MIARCRFRGTSTTNENKTPPPKRRRWLARSQHRKPKIVLRRSVSVLGRPGSDLLSQGLSHSTIGAEEFNGRVRDGIGFRLLARTTRPAKDRSGIRGREDRRQEKT